MPANVPFTGLGKLTINNPGNLEKTKSGTPWQGEVTCTSEPRFACFTDIAHGYRAMFILLQNYITAGSNTITKMISKWAPPSDNNDTAAYISTVSKGSGIAPNAVINSNDIDSLAKIITQMSRVENGVAAKAAEVAAGEQLAKERFAQYVKAGGIGAGVILIIGLSIYLLAKS